MGEILAGSGEDTTLSTLFLDEHVVETIALQEIDTIVVLFVTLAHAHIGGNHDVSFTIMHTGDVGIAGTAFDEIGRAHV